MSKNLPAKYYQGNKKNYQIKIFMKRKRKKVTIWPQTLQKYISR